MGSALGVLKTAARRLDLSLEAYLARVDAGEKWCGGCREWHSRSAFGVDAARSDGLMARCLDSRVTASARPGARERRIQAAAGLSWCRGCSAWKRSSEVQQGACRTHLNEEARGFYASNPGPTRERKRARRRGLVAVPAWWREERFEEFGGLCAYGCGRAASTLDHVWPVARGGDSRPDNLVPACVSCNSSKKDSDPEPWLTRLADAFPGLFFEFMALNCHHGGPFDVHAEVSA